MENPVGACTGARVGGANFLLDVIPYRHSECGADPWGALLALCQALALTSENDFGTLYRPGFALAPPTDGLLLRNPCEYGPFQAVVRRRYLDPEMERGRALRWVACVGILSASRRAPSASIRAQLSRVRSQTNPSFRYSSGDAARSLPEGGRGGPGAASPPQCLAPRATTTKPARLLRAISDGPGPRNDGGGFLPFVTSEGRELLAMTRVGYRRTARPW